MIAQSEPCKFAFTLTSLTDVPHTLLGNYPIQCSLQIFDVTKTESLVSFSLKILFILCLRSLCGCGECHTATRETDRRPSTPVMFLFTSLPVEVSQIVETDSASDIYRPCALHDLSSLRQRRHVVVSVS